MRIVEVAMVNVTSLFYCAGFFSDQDLSKNSTSLLSNEHL